MKNNKKIIILTIVIIATLIVFSLLISKKQPTYVPQGIGSMNEIYQNNQEGISLRYPKDYTVDSSYKYQEFGPGKDISGTKFTIPSLITEGTNLSSDSYISVEQIPNVKTCTTNLFLDDPNITTRNVKESGKTFSLSTSTGAAAGNRYEEMVYVLPNTNPCIAIRYFIHYGAIENYTAGDVKEFDKQALIKQFDTIRNSLVVNE